VFLYPFLLVKFKTIQHYLTKNKKAKKKKKRKHKKTKTKFFSLSDLFWFGKHLLYLN